jgi:hypothetical protein
MSDTDDEKKFPTPTINARKPPKRSLDLASVDMRKSGVTDNVAVSKGEASTFGSIVPGPKKTAEDHD